jgi:hypothetical protein
MTAPCARLSLFRIGHVRTVQIVHLLTKAAIANPQNSNDRTTGVEVIQVILG